jgi:hypothetical protein
MGYLRPNRASILWSTAEGDYEFSEETDVQVVNMFHSCPLVN